MRAAKADANQPEIVSALRQVGCCVQHLHGVGKGCPDLMLWAPARQQYLLIEVKDGSKPPSARKLTPDQQKWHREWKGPIAIVSSVEEALEAVKA